MDSRIYPQGMNVVEIIMQSDGYHVMYDLYLKFKMFASHPNDQYVLMCIP